MSPFLLIAALLLLIVIGVQNYLYPPLREETISDGLYGPYHWFLDGSFIILSIALGLTFIGKGFIEEGLAIGGAIALMMTAITNTFSTWIDKITNGLHNKLHAYFTGVVFLTMIGLEINQDHGNWWWLTGVTLLLPVAVVGLCQIFKHIKIGPAAEKAGVFGLCLWLIAYAINN